MCGNRELQKGSGISKGLGTSKGIRNFKMGCSGRRKSIACLKTCSQFWWKLMHRLFEKAIENVQYSFLVALRGEGEGGHVRWRTCEPFPLFLQKKESGSKQWKRNRVTRSGDTRSQSVFSFLAFQISFEQRNHSNQRDFTTYHRFGGEGVLF